MESLAECGSSQVINVKEVCPVQNKIQAGDFVVVMDDKCVTGTNVAADFSSESRSRGDGLSHV